MPLTRQQRLELQPFARWLLDFIDEHGLTVNTLARQAGLSNGTLRVLITNPKRVPEIETCLRLAKATGTAPDEIMRLANLPYTLNATTSLDPDRASLLETYDTLPPTLRRALMNFAHSLREMTAAERRECQS